MSERNGGSTGTTCESGKKDHLLLVKRQLFTGINPPSYWYKPLCHHFLYHIPNWYKILFLLAQLPLSTALFERRVSYSPTSYHLNTQIKSIERGTPPPPSDIAKHGSGNVKGGIP